MRLLLTGGGTGGHIFPAIALAMEVHSQSASNKILYVGSRVGMEASIVPEAGIEFKGITTRKLRKVASLDTVAVLLSLLKGYREAKNVIKTFRPDVAIGTGGYVAGATIFAAARLKIPTVILGPDAAPGRTNLWLSRYVKRVCIWLGDVDGAFPRGKTTVTGMPVRRDIVSPVAVEEARVNFGLSPDDFTVLVIGGSQGAQRLNELVVESLKHLPTSVQVLHQTGAKNIDQILSQQIETKARHIPVGFMNASQTPLAYRSADMIICRSGVSTLAESALNGLPMFMVPLPSAYADHQTLNAAVVVNAGAGKLLRQPELTGQVIADEICQMMSDRSTYDGYGTKSLAMGRPLAARDIITIASGYLK